MAGKIYFVVASSDVLSKTKFIVPDTLTDFSSTSHAKGESQVNSTVHPITLPLCLCLWIFVGITLKYIFEITEHPPILHPEFGIRGLVEAYYYPAKKYYE